MSIICMSAFEAYGADNSKSLRYAFEGCIGTELIMLQTLACLLTQKVAREGLDSCAQSE